MVHSLTTTRLSIANFGTTTTEKQSKSPKPKAKNGYTQHRYHHKDVVDFSTKAQALIGSSLGVGLSLAMFAKHQNLKLKNPLNLFKVKYGVKEMIAMSAFGVVGGVLGGLIGAKKKKEKIDEGVFQFMNATVPLLAVTPVTKFLDKSPKLKNNLPLRIGAIFVTLLAGMKGAAEISNFINDPNDKVPDRKLTMKDAVANMDDALGAFAVAKVPMMDKAEKILPFVYVWCGYRAGQSN